VNSAGFQHIFDTTDFQIILPIIMSDVYICNHSVTRSVSYNFTLRGM